MTRFGVFPAVSFVLAFVRKMLNFPLGVMVWSLLVDIEEVLWEVVNTHKLLESWGWKARNLGDNLQ